MSFDWHLGDHTFYGDQELCRPFLDGPFSQLPGRGSRGAGGWVGLNDPFLGRLAGPLIDSPDAYSGLVCVGHHPGQRGGSSRGQLPSPHRHRAARRAGLGDRRKTPRWQELGADKFFQVQGWGGGTEGMGCPKAECGIHRWWLEPLCLTPHLHFREGYQGLAGALISQGPTTRFGQGARILILFSDGVLGTTWKEHQEDCPGAPGVGGYFRTACRNRWPWSPLAGDSTCLLRHQTLESSLLRILLNHSQGHSWLDHTRLSKECSHHRA